MSKSILQNSNECYLCGTTQWLETHHVFGASNRDKSEKYGLVVRLCHYCHNEPPIGVHHNRDTDLMLKQIAQEEFQKRYPDINFVQLFGRNYL